MDRQWIKDRRFSSLSIKDLLDARDAYHVHLAHLDHVFATAIGRYLVRNSEVKDDGTGETASAVPEPRTLANSSAHGWSWPCILVFVDQWEDRAAFAAQPDSMVPRYLYLPDGRVIPTCVVAANRSDAVFQSAPSPTFPSDLVGGGYPVLTEVQGQRRVGSVGCMVTDGDGVYALTNRHVTGEAGREVKTVVSGVSRRIGVSAGKDLGKRPFADVYAGWGGAKVLVNLDAGLIRVDSVDQWTAQVYGVGQIGSIWDLNVDTFNLDLIGCHVRAYGAAGGDLSGQIQALFFRYKTVGGFEYVSDFLIAPRRGEVTVGTRPGDSGTLWFEDTRGEALKDGETAPKPPRPFAVQWGGQSLTAPGADLSNDFALATCLSTICRELDVEVISDWNVGRTETWGPVGHYKVGALACEQVKDDALRAFFMLNQKNIGYEDGVLQHGLPKHKQGDFVPLADVADVIWRDTRKADDNNHFADMDKVATAGPFAGESLLSLTDGKPQNVHPDVWNDFYKGLNEAKRGGLPIRVWLIYDAMVEAAAHDRFTEYLCAGGLMAHYVGDACQPLHISQFHHGRGKAESGVHSAYETAMLNSFTDELLVAIGKAKQHPVDVPVVDGSGHAAAVAVVELMRRTVTRLPPLRVVEVYAANPGQGRGKAMWQALGDETGAGILDGATTLARIWEGAWALGRKGKGAAQLPTEAFKHDALAALYNTDDFVKSYPLQEVTEAGGRIVPK